VVSVHIFGVLVVSGIGFLVLPFGNFGMLLVVACVYLALIRDMLFHVGSVHAFGPCAYCCICIVCADSTVVFVDL
jgi:hypothetical protein